MNINIRIHFLLVFIVTLYTTSTYAQELLFKGFKHLDDITARIDKRRDVNGQYCALVKIIHNFEDFQIETGKGYEHLEEKTGETWVWISPDEYRIIIKKKGYLAFQCDVKGKIVSLETYELILTDEYGNILVEAPNSKIWLDNKFVAYNKYEFNLKQGFYTLKVTQYNCYDEEKFVELKAGEKIVLNFNLKHKKGELKFAIFPKGINPDIYLNNKIIDNNNLDLKLDIGVYDVCIKKNKYTTFSKTVAINESKTEILNVNLTKEPNYFPFVVIGTSYSVSFSLENSNYSKYIHSIVSQDPAFLISIRRKKQEYSSSYFYFKIGLKNCSYRYDNNNGYISCPYFNLGIYQRMKYNNGKIDGFRFGIGYSQASNKNAIFKYGEISFTYVGKYLYFPFSFGFYKTNEKGSENLEKEDQPGSLSFGVGLQF